MKKAKFKLETLTCPTCIQKIEAAVKSFEGIEVESVNVRFNSSKLIFNYDEEKVALPQVKSKIEAMGYQVLEFK